LTPTDFDSGESCTTSAKCIPLSDRFILIDEEIWIRPSNGSTVADIIYSVFSKTINKSETKNIWFIYMLLKPFCSFLIIVEDQREVKEELIMLVTSGIMVLPKKKFVHSLLMMSQSFL